MRTKVAFLYMLTLKLVLYLFYSDHCNSLSRTHLYTFRWYGYTVVHLDIFHRSLNILLHTCCSDKLKHDTVGVKTGPWVTSPNNQQFFCCFFFNFYIWISSKILQNSQKLLIISRFDKTKKKQHIKNLLFWDHNLRSKIH